ncbi:MAG: heat-inducible transcriptional repressor HrcA [Propionibacteriaceae bacterium]|nr:heat-inducible transcriptional repressor HrcA [Propionibacteriaceae bacterium]
MLDERKLAILRAIVTDYVSMREPVGSKALVDRYHLNVSPATVRNDMAVLEEEGYITQPHTSAGRIPTDKGYRLFVDRLEQVKPLSAAEKRAIESFMAGAANIDDIVQRTVRLLAQITQQVAIVQYPSLTVSTVRHFDIVPLDRGRALIITVNSLGAVTQRNIDAGDADEQTIADLRARIATVIIGASPTDAVGKLQDCGGTVPEQMRPLAAVVVSALIEMLSDDPSAKVAVSGVPNLMKYSDQYETNIKPVVEALEEQVVLLKLLGEAVSNDDVVVRIGHENPYEPLQTTSMVASSYGSTTETVAHLGVLGPTRMDYPSTIAAVRAVARYVGRFLSES